MPKLINTPTVTKKDSGFPLDHIAYIGLDKMKFCVLKTYVKQPDRDAIARCFNELEAGSAQKLSAQNKAFQLRLAVMVAGEQVVIECSPNRLGYPYEFTAEFNPNYFIHGGVGALNELATFFRRVLGLGARDMLFNSVVTRFDVNVDFDINPLDGTLVSSKGKRGGANVMQNFEGDGTLGTLYVGALGSDRRLIIYDKAQEVLTRELAPQAGKLLAALASPEWNTMVKKLSALADEPPSWRVEVRGLPKPALSIKQLPTFSRCFDSIGFLHLPTDRAPFNTSLGRSFIGHARHVGVQVALQSLDEPDRRRMNRAISKLDTVEWWNTDILAGCISAALDKLAVLFTSPTQTIAEKGSKRIAFTRTPTTPWSTQKTAAPPVAKHPVHRIG